MTRQSRGVLELGRGVLQCNVEYAFNKSTAIPAGSESASDELKTLFLLCFIFNPSSYITANGGNTFKEFVCQLNCWSSLTQAEHNLAIFALDNIRNRQSPSWQKGLRLATPNVHRKHFHEAKSPPLYMFLICGPSLTSLSILIIHKMYAKSDLVWDLLHELTCSPLGGRGKDSIESIWIYQMQKLWIWRTSLNRVKLSIFLKRCKISFGLPFSDIYAMGGRREAAAQCWTEAYHFVKSVFLLQLGNLWSVWSIQMGGRSPLSRAALLMDIPCSGITETSEQFAVRLLYIGSNQCTQGSEVPEAIRVPYEGEHWTAWVNIALCVRLNRKWEIWIFT